MPVFKIPSALSFSGIPTAIFAVTKADSDLPNGVTVGLNVGTAGTANLIDGSGNTLTNYPLHQGYNPGAFLQVKTGGTADNIWACY